jgi:hypothetical protein
MAKERSFDDILDLLKSDPEDIHHEDVSSDSEEDGKKQNHSPLWVNASDVSGITGYNKYTDILQVTSDYIYKGRSDLLAKDEAYDVKPLTESQAIDVSINKTSDAEAIMSLVNSVPETHTDLQKLNNQIEDQVQQAAKVVTNKEQEILEKLLKGEDIDTDDRSVLQDGLSTKSNLSQQEQETLTKIATNTLPSEISEEDLAQIGNIINKKTLTDDEVDKLTTQLKSTVNRSFGARKEHVAIRLYEQQT